MIELEYPLDEAYFLRSHRVLRRRDRWIMAVSYLLLTLILLLILVVRIATDFKDGFTVADGLVIGFLLVIVLAAVSSGWRERRRIRKIPGLGCTIRWQIGRDNLRSVSSHSEGMFDWSMVYRLRETSSGFLLYPQENVQILLPVEAFVSEADKEKLREYARAAGKFKK